MRILALTTDAYGGGGGIAQYNRDLVDALAAMPEVESIVMLARTAPVGDRALPPKVREHRRAGFAPAYAAFALWLALRHRPDVILCGHLNLLPVGAILRRMLGARLVLEIYGIEAWEPAGSRFTDWCVRQADRIVSISRYTLRRFSSWAPVRPGRITVVPNAIRLERYAMRAKPAQLVERLGLAKRKVLLTVGRLDPSDAYKGQDRIIGVLAEAARAEPRLVYVIAGAGADRARLEALAREHGVAERVRFTGYVADAELGDLYNLADAFAMPSTGEGFGFVFLEAAACGLPVLGGDQDGSPDALGDGRIGVMVDPRDERALLAALLRVLAQPRSIPEALRAYDATAFAAQVSALFSSLARASPRAA